MLRQQVQFVPLEPWEDFAACRDVPNPEIFTWESNKTKAPYKKAKAICAECPVKLDCLEFAIRTKQVGGIWGGKSETERRRIRRGRAA